MFLAAFLKFLHVAAAMWMVTGIIGRTVVLAKAGRSADIHEVRTLLPLSTIFEKSMVIPGSSAVLIAGLVTAWAEGWPVLGFIQGGSANWVLAALLLYLTTIPLIIFVFTPRGKVFEAAFQEAVKQERITSELSMAFNDPAVRAAHRYELAILVVIVALMVLKPF
jgi:hypothetical protein